ncbi:MAG TPA: MarR family winged helix-turn-helix transcriptional regulator [Sphingomonas sp.]|jgi:DNA-binding MarR family transcriptional regulator|nr:MarR family winged helix-turn-helix transcriptional regulator [Sphingomonas sp.]
MNDDERSITGYSRGERCAVVIIAEPGRAGDAREAAALIGGRVLQELPWASAGDRLVAAAASPILLIEAEGVGVAALDLALPRIDAFASALDLPMVVTFSRSQIDPIAAHLLGRHVQLLCAPTMSDRVAALAVAAELVGTPALNDTWRESEATRLQKLNEEVARIADLLARLTRNEAPGEIEDRRSSYHAEAPRADTIDPQELRRAIRARRLREQFLGAGLFEDPAWDMLLDLYAAELEHAQVSVSSLCIAAAVAPTTALRWISKMTEAGLFVRQPDPQDRRRAFMALSPHASEAMRSYIAAIQRADLSIG